MNAPEPLPSLAGSDGWLQSLETLRNLPDDAAGEQWEERSRAVLKEAIQATSFVSSRRWTVVHPGDRSMHTLLAQLEFDGAPQHQIEMPRIIRWRSKFDGQLYTLVEFFRLARQAGPAGRISTRAVRPTRARHDTVRA